MDLKKKDDRKNRILMGIYSSSMGISMTALSVVAALEVFMLVYTVIDPPLFGQYMGIYRAFYVSLLTVALGYIALNLYVKKDMENRYRWLNIANPVCAVFFFAWALGITCFDAMKFHIVDSTVFMTFSMTVPLSFFLLPPVYGVVAVLADAVMLYITVVVAGSAAPLINNSIFFIFQLVLGISFLQLKVKLAERIVEEQENAGLDIMTGFPNRRAYEEDMEALASRPLQENLAYIALDMNGLKEANDKYGHATGDKLLIGTARCLEQSFGGRGKIYRVGGDEFSVIAGMGQNELEELLHLFEECMKAWTDSNGIPLSASYGYVCREEYPEYTIAELARVADERMYMAKTRYYRRNGKDRRRYLAEEQTE